MTKETYLKVVDILKNIIAGSKFEGHVYTVGGCVRDLLLGRSIKDIDIVVDLPNGGIELAEWLKKNNHTKGSVVTYPHFGTAMFVLKDMPDVELEAVQTRKEVYRDMESRNPETVFGTIQDDRGRRDFTYNALYNNISTNKLDDFNDGNSFTDLENNILRTCGEPDLIFSDDPLRILRCIRFKVRYGSTIEDKTYNGMFENVHRLEILSRERIQDEVAKMLSCDAADDAVDMLFKIGAIKYIFPNVAEPYDSNVYSNRIKMIGSTDYRVNLAILLKWSSDPRADLMGLRFSNDVINYVMFLLEKTYCIYTALYQYDWYLREAQLHCGTYERFLDKCKLISISSNSFPYLDMKKIIQKTDRMISDGTAMFGYKLPVDGYDVMDVLGIGPSPDIKRILSNLLDYACENPWAKRDDFLEKIKQL